MRWLTFALLVAASTTAHAGQTRRMAVLEFSVASSASLDHDELQILSDQVRAGGMTVLPEGFLMMTRESMITILREMGKRDCTEGECEVDTLRNIGAEFGITGHVAQIEGMYLATMKMFDARQGALLATVKVEGETKRKLLDEAERAAVRLVRTGLKLDRPVAAVAAPVAIDGGQFVSLGVVFEGNDQVVRDRRTLLLWQRRAYSELVTVQEADAYCRDLSLGGLRGWRLPTFEEAYRLIDRGYREPTLDRLAFGSAARAETIWTSTVDERFIERPHKLVAYDYGRPYVPISNGLPLRHNARCVRSAAPR